MEDACPTVNAIERLRGLVRVSNPTPGEQDALAAVDALYQAAKELDDSVCGITEDGHNLVPIEDVIALAAAVRRIEGEA